MKSFPTEIDIPRAPRSLARPKSEIWTGVASFQRWLGTTPASDLREALVQSPSWDTLLAALLKYNLEFVPTPRGAVVHDRNNLRHYGKASHLGTDFGLRILEMRLGPFQAAPDLSLSLRETSYANLADFGELRMAWVQNPQVVELRQRYDLEIAHWHESGRMAARTEWDAVHAIAGARIKEHKRTRKQAFAEIRALVNPPISKADLRTAFGAGYDAQLVLIRRQNAEERAAVRSAHQAPSSCFESGLRSKAMPETKRRDAL